ncbi:MAG: hypothetical protein WC179_01975 [Candidatus Cloacimonadaceae bacterium]|jgi:hypothetical protein|nr:hypothetical protein [Candidatus Cloacimonadota bacterium]MDY0111371.1 hypothetical protein [Candidatus Syntrophosphaera sp.]
MQEGKFIAFFEIPFIQVSEDERIDYSTQNPEDLMYCFLVVPPSKRPVDGLIARSIITYAMYEK